MHLCRASLLLMTLSCALRSVPVHPPRMPAPVDEVALLGGPIHLEHTTVLPGYAVGRVIGEGGFCQVRMGC